MAKFRKKPVVIEATQFFAAQTPWPKGVVFHERCESENAACSYDGSHLIRTLEGAHIVSEGDWVITGVQGERYPCKPDIFAATYDAVAD